MSLEDPPKPKRLRSAVWSSETLVTGMRAIDQQQKGMMIQLKDEEDKDLVDEYNVLRLYIHSKFCLVVLGCSGNPTMTSKNSSVINIISHVSGPSHNRAVGSPG